MQGGELIIRPADDWTTAASSVTALASLASLAVVVVAVSAGEVAPASFAASLRSGSPPSSLSPLPLFFVTALRFAMVYIGARGKYLRVETSYYIYHWCRGISLVMRQWKFNYLYLQGEYFQIYSI